MATANDVLRVARAELGYDRFKDPEQGTKYGRWYALSHGAYFGTNGVPFCAMFVSWVLEQAGQRVAGFPAAYCPYALRDGKNAGIMVDVSQAQPGDVVFFDWGKDGLCDHVGFVEANNGSYLTTIEGNTSGGKVARRTRAYSTVCGVARPAYDGVSTMVQAQQPKPKTRQISVDGWLGEDTTRLWQEVMGTTPDGIISNQRKSLKKHFPRVVSCRYSTRGASELIKAVQRRIGVVADGIWGRVTTIALQRYLGVAADGIFGAISVMALQRRLNEGRF